MATFSGLWQLPLTGDPRSITLGRFQAGVLWPEPRGWSLWYWVRMMGKSTIFPWRSVDHSGSFFGSFFHSCAVAMLNYQRLGVFWVVCKLQAPFPQWKGKPNPVAWTGFEDHPDVRVRQMSWDTRIAGYWNFFPTSSLRIFCSAIQLSNKICEHTLQNA